METSAENTPTCPTCGQPRLADHQCPDETPESSDQAARIQIPEALRNTGLFRAAWKPTHETDDAPATGSIFIRPPEATADEVDEADLVPPAEATSAPAEEPDLERDPRLGPPEDDFLFGTDGDASEVSEVSGASEPSSQETSHGETAIDEVPLSPIATAEATAIAAAAESVAAAEPESIALPALDETATYDLAGAFAQEAAAQAALEPVPTPEQSAYDLYGDSLYAPEPGAQESSLMGSIDAITPPEGIPVVEDPEFPVTESTTPFASRLSTAGVTSASLPTSVPFAPGAEQTPDVPAPDSAAGEDAPKKRRKPVGIIAAVIAVVLVAAGGTWWWSAQKDAPVKDAFTASHDSFVLASSRLERAESVEDIAAAGAALEQSLPSLKATSDTARETDSDVATAARRVALAETAVAQAAAPLKDLSTDDLSAWSSAKEPLTEALEGLAAVRSDVATAGGSGDSLPSTDLVPQLQGVIASEIVEGAEATVVDLGAKLESASVLADIRAVGSSAGEYVSALSEALGGVEDQQQKSDLNAVVEFHKELSDFTQVRSSTFDRWKGLRKDASAAARALASGSDEAQAGIEAADVLVTGAQLKFESWETKHAAAKAKKAADAQAIKDAVAAVSAADDSYSTLYGNLESLVNEVSSLPSEGTQGEAYARLNDAATAREEMVNSLSGFSLVPNSAKRLDALVAALTADAEAVRAAASAAGTCTEGCRLASLPAFQSLGTVTSEAATAWNDAMGPWESTTTAAAEKIAARALPKRPKI